MKYSIKDWGKGLSLDAMPSELEPGYCSGADNVRFRNGFAERVLGYSTVVANGATWMTMFSGVAGPCLVYVSATAFSYNLASTHTALTRFTEGVAISSITQVGTTATVTTATNHGRTTGDAISLWGASPSAYNVDSVTITVTGATTFTYTMASAPGVNATVVGLYAYNGAASNFSVVGKYSGGILNGVVIFNSPNDGVYYWGGTLGVRLRKIPAAPKAYVARTFKNYIVLLSPYDFATGVTRYPWRVQWSAAADPGSIPTSFTAAATNDSGQVDLADTGGEVRDCLPLGDANIIYKTDGRYAMRYIGGNSVFSFTRLPGTDGVLYWGCVADTPVGHVFLSSSMEVLLHTGGECRNLSRGRVKTLLDQFPTTSSFAALPFVFANTAYNEVWVCFFTTGSTVKKILMWNWVDDTWGVKTIVGTFNEIVCAAGGLPDAAGRIKSVYVGNTSRVGLADGAADDFGTAFDSYIERTGLDLGDTDVVKNFQRSRWNFDGAAGAVFSVQHGSSMTADATPTYTSAATYTLGTSDYANSRAAGGRFLAAKVTWNSTSLTAPGRVRSCDLDVTPGGKR